MSSTIHETAVVHPSAILGEGVEIGPYACVGEQVVIGRGSILASHAIVRRGSILGDDVRVDSFAVVGGDPQMLGFDPATDSGVTVGNGVVIREGVTINRATRPGTRTTVGDHAMLMSGSHVGHDCKVGSHVTLANNVMLAGHVEVGCFAFLGGGAGVHQFVRVGEGTMVGGNASISYDLPPFTIAAQRNEVYGLNLVGLKRRRFSAESIADLKNCFHAVYSVIGDLRKRAAGLSGGFGYTEAGRSFLGFFAGGRRGFAAPRRGHGEGNGRRGQAATAPTDRIETRTEPITEAGADAAAGNRNR